jgi:hypothetical protein
MTPAERKTASRANQKAKQEDAERRNLVAEMLRIIRRNQSAPGGDITVVREQDIKAANRKFIRALHADLLRLSVDKLRESLEALKSLPDSRGRLHNERSGEAERSMGQSEMERILAGMQHNSSLFETGDEDADIQDPKMARGFQFHPDGSGPDSFEKDSDADSADVRSGAAKPGWVKTANEKWVQRTIESILNRMSFESEGTKCPFCFEVFLTPFGVWSHLEDQYEQGKKDQEHHQEYSYAIAEMNSFPSMPGGGIPVAVEPNTRPYVHFKLINQEIESLRKQSRKKQKPGIS